MSDIFNKGDEVRISNPVKQLSSHKGMEGTVVDVIPLTSASGSVDYTVYEVSFPNELEFEAVMFFHRELELIQKGN